MKLFGVQTGGWANKIFKTGDTYYYYSSREEYYKSIFHEADMKSLYLLVDMNVQIPVITNTKIKFREIEFGTARAEVVKILGSPRYKIINQKYSGAHQVLFYKFEMGGFRTVTQLHFLNNFFFYASYTFKDLNKTSLAKVEEVLNSKYFGNKDGKELSGLAVADTENNRLFVTKGLYLTVKYVSGNQKIHDDIVRLMHTRQEKNRHSERQQQESLLDFL